MNPMNAVPAHSHRSTAQKAWKYVIALSFTLLLGLILTVSANAALCGDVDGDVYVTASDARLALRASVSMESLDDDQFTAADVDFDNTITASDARAILRTSVGLEQFMIPLKETEQFTIAIDHWNWSTDGSDTVDVTLFAENKTASLYLFFDFYSAAVNRCMINYFEFDDAQSQLAPGQRKEIHVYLYPYWLPYDFEMLPPGLIVFFGGVFSGRSAGDYDTYLDGFNGGVYDSSMFDIESDYTPEKLVGTPVKGGCYRIGFDDYYADSESLIAILQYKNVSDWNQVVEVELNKVNGRSADKGSGIYPSNMQTVAANSAANIIMMFNYTPDNPTGSVLENLGIEPGSVKNFSVTIRVYDRDTGEQLYEESLTVNLK